jgi:hypothetical protein
MTEAAILENRGLLRLGGNDARALLQGLVTADITQLSDGHAIYAALLTPQGKFLFAFHVLVDPEAATDAETLLLETSGERLTDLERRLTLYRLRAAVTIEPCSPMPSVAVLFGDDAVAIAELPRQVGAMRRGDGLTFMVDPRLAAFGVRLYGERSVIESWLADRSVAVVNADRLDRHRIALAVPEPDIDLVVDKTIMLEAGLDQLGAVAFDKGCFVGQELTARTRYRGLVKRRLVPVALENAVVEPGFAVMAGEREAGEIRSVGPGMALALLRLDRLGEPLEAGGGRVYPRPAPWQDDLAERLRGDSAAT